MIKKIFIVLAILIVSFSFYYYWQNRYVELRPVLSKEYTRPIIVFQNDYYRIAERNETPPNFYENIRYVLGRENQDYIEKDGIIYIKYKYMNDLEMIWNHTLKTNNLKWYKTQRRMDSINGDDYKKYKFHQ
ncbi:hypothetical protein [Flavobacterium hercynium]|uniref:Uncharacterized protein n=1 Tax=Flavobacterium hercynium TaxID=387094 RepID=A0A226GSJ2_9FLAO|nr:hypothetical protein [Flavobacterium hercynium]OXA84983.1 hypothetical protein B0A66_20195 [Flavobacterium hercynium]PAM93452.1 hypothetical protein B4N84_18075 [Flavobacterium sp. IR1]SMP35180.1 hypothetical protein SAMN06265346_11957 [Flavobacterium hercynium]